MKQMYDKILLQDLGAKHLYTKVNGQWSMVNVFTAW